MQNYVDKEAESLAIIQKLNFRGPFKAELISGGLSGSTLIKVSNANQSFICRFWNMRWAKYFPQDLACQIIASQTGYGPKLFYTNETSGLSVMEYIQSEKFPKSEVKLRALVDLLKKIHSGPILPKGIDKSKDIDESIEETRKLNLQFLDLDQIWKIKEDVFKVTRRNCQSVACHRDLHPGNLIYNHARFIAIDYTWAGMDDPYSDLATLTIFNCMNLEEEILLLSLYLGRQPNSSEMARLSLMKLTAKIFYALVFLQLASVDDLNKKFRPNSIPKCYMNFGFNRMTSTDFIQYAVSLLSEVEEYSQSDLYIKDCLIV